MSSSRHGSGRPELTVLVVSDYRGFRIEIAAVAADGRWNADVRVRRLFSQEKPRAERVTCYKLTAEHAERAAEIWARRWVDLQVRATAG
jgi:hypothetical protein